jgi:hypothetical protein
MFEDLRRLIDTKQTNLVKMETFLQRMSDNEDLFDVEDQTKVQDIYRVRSEEYAKIAEEFKVAMELYKDKVADLETRIIRRQQVLETIETEVGAISAEPVLADHFSRKQALLQNNIRTAKAMLCATIKEKLEKSIKTQ